MDAGRARRKRATWVSVAVNLLMTIAQIIRRLAGAFAVADRLHGLHSFSDLLSDFLVIYASRQSAHPADDQAHLRPCPVETAATLVLGVRWC